jgi:hypothetical protein
VVPRFATSGSASAHGIDFHMMPVLKAVTYVQTDTRVLFREFFRDPRGTNFAEVKSVLYDFIGGTVIDVHLFVASSIFTFHLSSISSVVFIGDTLSAILEHVSPFITCFAAVRHLTALMFLMNFRTTYHFSPSKIRITSTCSSWCM